MAKKKGMSGLPGSAGKGQIAQSGGKNHTFGGGKGGTRLSREVTKGRAIDRGRNSAGLDYTVRSPGGDKTMLREGFHVGGTPPQTTGGDQSSIQSKRKVRGRPVAGSS